MRTLRLAAAIALSVALVAGGAGMVAAPASAAGSEQWGCVHGVGYYKNTVNSVANWDPARLPSIPVRRVLFYMPYALGMSTQQILDAPARGDAKIISAKQMIAAAMNMHHNYAAEFPTEFMTAYGAFFNYYVSGGVRTLTRQQMLEYSGVLAAFNSGESTLPPC